MQRSRPGLYLALRSLGTNIALQTELHAGSQAINTLGAGHDGQSGCWEDAQAPGCGGPAPPLTNCQHFPSPTAAGRSPAGSCVATLGPRQGQQLGSITLHVPAASSSLSPPLYSVHTEHH